MAAKDDIKLKIGNNVKDYWRVLLNKASTYQRTIIMATRLALQKMNIDTNNLSDEEVIELLLPGPKERKSPWIELNNENEYTYTVNGVEFNAISGDPFLSKARQDIVKHALQQTYNESRERRISGVYAEQYLVNALDKKLQDEYKDVAKIGDLIDAQMNAMDFNIKIPVQVDSKKLTKTMYEVINNYGLVFDYKKDINQPFDVTQAGKENDIIQQLNLNKFDGNFSDRVIGQILYNKYGIIQPFFYSNKDKKSVLLPADFFRDKTKFEVAKYSFRPEKKITRKEVVDIVGITEEEQYMLEPTEIEQMSTIVVEEIVRDSMIKYFAIKYKGKGSKS